MMIARAVALASVWLLAAGSLVAQESISRGRNMSVDVATDGRIAIDLAGDIWVVPPGGGEARRLTRGARAAHRPRWSPDASTIAYQGIADGAPVLWLCDVASGESRLVSRDKRFSIHPAWHPDGERIVYASDRSGEGFDLWEVDLPTGLHWRLSSRGGDELEPSWSGDGRHLVYVHYDGDQWSLVLRLHSRPEEILVTTTDKLAAPSWRPDGSLITYLRSGDAGSSLEMVILSDPRLVREYAPADDFAPAPVSWLDKQQMFYTANGQIRRRMFDSWTSSPLLFRAMIEPPTMSAEKAERRPLPRIDEPQGRLIIRAARVFDGLGNRYLRERDIIIDGGRIAAVEPRADRTGAPVIDLGDLTILPGYVDAHAGLPETIGDGLGARLLTAGVTTIVADHDDANRLNELWSGKASPGPRLLPRTDWPASATPAIADAMTPGLDLLLTSRQGRLLDSGEPVARRFAEPPTIDAGVTSVVLGSRDNGLEPGLAVHAEFRAQSAAGLEPAQSLRAAGVNAAAALGADPFLGRIAVGAVADLVFVDGDPLQDIDDALNVVAVVRNGRFFSVSGLIERAAAADSVE